MLIQNLVSIKYNDFEEKEEFKTKNKPIVFLVVKLKQMHLILYVILHSLIFLHHYSCLIVQVQLPSRLKFGINMKEEE